MRLFLFVGAVVSLGLAGWNFYAVIDELRRSLPPQFSDLDLRRAVGIHVWTPAVSDAARLRFVWFNLWLSVSFSLGAILLWMSGELNGAGAFGGLAVLVIAYIAWQCYRYWVRGQQNRRHMALRTATAARDTRRGAAAWLSRHRTAIWVVVIILAILGVYALEAEHKRAFSDVMVVVVFAFLCIWIWWMARR